MNVEKEVEILRDKPVGDLRAKYAEVFGEESRSRHKDFLVKRIVWRLQAMAEGDLSERARKRAEEIARDADIRMVAPKGAGKGTLERTKVAELRIPSDKRLPMPGTVLTRGYKGQTIVVTVLPQGFEYEGEVYKSLSAVAKAVTGTHWNGYHFFNLLKGEGAHV